MKAWVSHLSLFFEMNITKGILLFCALLLPISIFLFLKFFGKNQFEVSLPYKSGVAEKPVGCDFEYASPYLIADSVFGQISADSETPLYVLNFSTAQRVIEERIASEATPSEVTIKSPNFNDEIKKCVLLTKPPYDVVLVDNQRQIRGYYVANNREDLDRLLIEISIILKKY